MPIIGPTEYLSTRDIILAVINGSVTFLIVILVIIVVYSMYQEIVYSEISWPGNEKNNFRKFILMIAS